MTGPSTNADVVMQNESSDIIEYATSEMDTSDATQNISNIHIKKTVKFSTVMIQDYPVIVGCNPAVSCGVPIELGWDPISQIIVPIQEYEIVRQRFRLEDSNGLIKPAYQRYQMLLKLGFTEKHLRRAENLAATARYERLQSYSEYCKTNDSYDDEYKIRDEYKSMLQSIQDEDRIQRQQRNRMLLRKSYSMLHRTMVSLLRRRH